VERGGSDYACDVDIFHLYVYLLVLECAGYACGPLYPRENALSTGMI
jgi:hypothetical protein